MTCNGFSIHKKNICWTFTDTAPVAGSGATSITCMSKDRAAKKSFEDLKAKATEASLAANNALKAKVDAD